MREREDVGGVMIESSAGLGRRERREERGERLMEQVTKGGIEIDLYLQQIETHRIMHPSHVRGRKKQ